MINNLYPVRESHQLLSSINSSNNTTSLYLANFVGCVIGFLSVCTTRDL